LTGPSADYVGDLLRAHETHSSAVTALLSHWSSVLQANRRRELVTSSIPRQDPLRDGTEQTGALIQMSCRHRHRQRLCKTGQEILSLSFRVPPPIFDHPVGGLLENNDPSHCTSAAAELRESRLGIFSLCPHR
jgi:hypothetical protein